jgi:CRP-like cAMP-binding protein
LFGALPQESISVSDVIAQNTLSVLEISAAKLDALSKESTQISHGLSMILARQYNRLLDRMANRISLTAIGRVYAELLNQANNRNVISPSPVIAALGLRAQTTRETASRAINTLLRRGIISRDGEQLKIVSRALLEDMVV